MTESSGQKKRRSMTWIVIIIIAILLVIISLFLLVQLPGESEPSVNLTIRQDQGTFHLTHDGGDSLSSDSIVIQINGIVIPSSRISFVEGQTWPFSIGKTIVIPYSSSTSPQKLTVYYVSGTSRTEIFTATILPATELPTVIPTISTPVTELDTPIVTPTTIPTTVPTTIPTNSPTIGPPQAAFDASPRSGPYPLTVSFVDLSAGSPGQWEWNFGDGDKSTGKDPVHTYTAPGTYTISLKVANAEGANTRIMQSYITVGETDTTEVTLDAEGPGSFLPGGFAQFVVAGNGARIKVGGKVITPLPGDTVRIILGSDGQGRISVHDPFILEWTFDDTEVEVNGQPAGSGRLNDLSIPAYDGFVSNLTLVLPPGSMRGRLIVEGVTEDLSTLPGGLTLRDFFPDQAGDLVVDTSMPASTYFQGSTAVIGN